MAPSTPPPLLHPYLVLPPSSSLTLLTSVLGASTNWLLLRYLQSFLSSAPPTTGHDPTSSDTQGQTSPSSRPKVLLVSLLRDYKFWRDGARRLGVDLDRLGREGRFGMVEGLVDGLFSETASPLSRAVVGSTKGVAMDEKAVIAEEGSWRTEMMKSGVESVYEEVMRGVRRLGGEGRSDEGSDVVLVIDGLDFLLAANMEEWDAVSAGEFVMGLREKVHSVVLALSSDDPLLKRQITGLETNHAAFLMEVAHEADLTLSLRLLDTGTARDVSGVVRIHVREKMEGSQGEDGLEDRELLYFVGRDGSVRVFERGQ